MIMRSALLLGALSLTATLNSKHRAGVGVPGVNRSQAHL